MISFSTVIQGNIFDEYFYLPPFRERLGQCRYKILDEGILQRQPAGEITLKDYLLTFVKILSYCTVILPLIFYVGKALQASSHADKIKMSAKAWVKKSEQMFKTTHALYTPAPLFIMDLDAYEKFGGYWNLNLSTEEEKAFLLKILPQVEVLFHQALGNYCNKEKETLKDDTFVIEQSAPHIFVITLKGGITDEVPSRKIISSGKLMGYVTVHLIKRFPLVLGGEVTRMGYSAWIHLMGIQNDPNTHSYQDCKSGMLPSYLESAQKKTWDLIINPYDPGYPVLHEGILRSGA